MGDAVYISVIRSLQSTKTRRPHRRRMPVIFVCLFVIKFVCTVASLCKGECETGSSTNQPTNQQTNDLSGVRCLTCSRLCGTGGGWGSRVGGGGRWEESSRFFRKFIFSRVRLHERTYSHKTVHCLLRLVLSAFDLLLIILDICWLPELLLTHTRTHAHTHTHTHTHTRARAHRGTRTQTLTHTHTHVHTHIYAHRRALTHTHTHAQTHLSIHAHTYARTQAHRHARTHVQTQPQWARINAVTA